MIDTETLQIFSRVVETRSFSGAARGLGLPKSTVSRKVAELESRLGARLLNRTTRRVEPTEVGQALYERSLRILDELGEAERAVSAAQSEPSGRLRITAPPDLADAVLAPLVAEYVRRHPRVEVEVALTGRVVDLVGEGFDVAIRAGVLRDSTLRARKLAPSRLGFFASPAYLEARGTPRCLADLAEHDCVLFTPTPRPRVTWRVRDRRGVEDLPVKGRVRVDDVELARSLAVCGVGVAYVPALACRGEVAAGRLRPVLEDHATESGGIYAVYPPTSHVSAKLRAFLDLMETPAFALEVD